MSGLREKIERLKGDDSEAAANDIILVSIPKDPDAASLEISVLFNSGGILDFLKYLSSFLIVDLLAQTHHIHQPERFY